MVDLSGIDDHTVRNLQLVTVGAVVNSNKGEIIIVLHHYADMRDGKTILSSGQMEHYRVDVNDKSPVITGITPSISIGGYVIPMSVLNGLCHLNLRPFTDKEWDTYPHVPLTEDKDWDPRVLDAMVPDDWYANQPKVIVDSIYDERGELREDFIQAAHDPTEPEDEGDEERDDRRTGRQEIEAHLHSLIESELQTDFYVYRVGNTLYDVDYNEGEFQPRRSSRRAGQPPVEYFPKEQKKKPKGESKAKASRQRKGPVPKDEDLRDKEPPRLTLDRNIFEEPSEEEEEPVVVLDYNNPAKTSDADPKALQIWEGGPKKLRPTPKTLHRISRYFPGFPLKVIQKTFEATTQYGRIGAIPGYAIRARIKAPNPALNVPRRDEEVATDAVYGPKGVPAVDDGSTCAQIYMGKSSAYRSVHSNGHSDGTFVRSLQDEIRKRGAMRVLISDRARAQISEAVKDILRTFGINDWQSEPYKKDQNYAERGWKDWKEKTNNVLNFSGAPRKVWLLALKYICWILNHSALEKLGWRTPFEWLFGYTPDISVLLQFIFYEPVYYAAIEPKVGDTPELMGRFVGISEHVGHGMTYMVLTESDKVIYRSDIRTAVKDGIFQNRRAEEQAPGVAPAPERVEFLSPFTKDDLQGPTEGHPMGSTPQVPHTREEVRPITVDDEEEAPAAQDGESGGPEPTEMFPQMYIPTAERVGDHPDHVHSFTEIRPPPEPSQGPTNAGPHPHLEANQGSTEANQGSPEAVHVYHDDLVFKHRPIPTIDVGSLVGRTFITEPDGEGEQHRAKVDIIEPVDEKTADGREALYKFRCSVKGKVFEEIITYNQMIDWCNRDMHRDDMAKFNAILDHRWDTKERKWSVLVEWDSGEITWNPLGDTYEGDPVTVAMYAKKNGLLDTDGWKRCKRLVKNSKTLARMANQVKLKNFRNRPVYKFGVQVPRNHKEAMWLDEKEGKHGWQESEQEELESLDSYESFKDMGKGAQVPEGYKAIPCHFVYDVKYDGRKKSRFVAGGHRTDTPVDSVYSGVVSIEGIRICTFLAELNDLELWSTDVGNAYLESYTKEKVCFYAGPEFGEREGHLLIIVKAQYGLKSSGKRWHERLYDVLTGMGFFPSKAEEDIWMRDMGDHYEYIAVYVDDLLIASRNPMAIIEGLEKVPFKLKGTGEVTYHLGCDYYRDEDGTLCVGPKRYIEKMVTEYERLYGSKPSTKSLSPLEANDHPELDTSPILDEDGVRQYQSLIGTLQWAITLGRFNIAMAVMTMSSFRVAPREGHLERVKRICGYLYKFKSGCIRIRTEEPDYSSLPHHQYDWARTCYGNAREEVPRDAPTPKGKRVVLTSYKDANLYHDLATGKSVTGALHFINQTPVAWFSKKQETVETATYGSEFVAARTAIQQIMALRLNLRYLGVPIHGATQLFGDNKSVVTSGSIPHSRLTKRHHGLSYHFTREAVASDMISFHHLPGPLNPADILSKHWGYSQVWTFLQPLLFWRGNTAHLLDPDTRDHSE